MSHSPIDSLPWRRVAPLGAGGMGLVWRVVHDDGREAALKTVRVANPSALGAIRREIHALARLRHPGIVQLLDHGVTDGLPWYVMERIDGPTLHDRWLTAA